MLETRFRDTNHVADTAARTYNLCSPKPVSKESRSRRAWGVAAFALFVLAQASHSQEASDADKLSVGATVVPHVRWSLEKQPAVFEITPADLERGYVEVTSAQLIVQTNDPAGYVLTFALDHTHVRFATIRGLASPVIVGPGGAFGHQPFTGTDSTRYSLSWRFELSSSAQPGVYAWPLRLAVRQPGRRRA